MANRKELMNILAAMNPMSKQEVIRINISSTFLPRVRCKECGEGPDYYYASMKPIVWKDIKHFVIYSKIAKKWVKRMVTNWYQEFQPRYFSKLGDFSFALDAKSFNAALHRVKGTPLNPRENVVEYVGCSCGSTVWSFNDKSIKNRPEITNRRGRYKYPQKFVY